MSFRERILMATSLYVALMVVFFFLVVDPQWSRLNELRAQESKLQRELRKLKQRTDEEPVGAGPGEQVRSQFGDLLTVTSEAAHAAKIIDTVSQLARESGVRILAYHPRAKRLDDDHWVRFPMELTVEGTIAELTDLLYRLTFHPWLLDVERVTFRTRSGQSRVLNCDLVVSSSAFVKEVKLGKRSVNRGSG